MNRLRFATFVCLLLSLATTARAHIASNGFLTVHVEGSNLTGTLASDIMQRSTADLGLDPASSLPAVLAYSIRPDNGAPIPIAIEIHYSNYQAVNGVQIPFTIQRYVNGSLQLEISVSSAQVN